MLARMSASLIYAFIQSQHTDTNLQLLWHS
jgi:hypothetical protein